MTSPVIVELALNGATPRTRNRHVPRAPEEIAEVALEGIDLGASIVHNHNDEPMFTLDAVHAIEPYVAAWEPVLARHPDVLLYPTMGAGARGIPVQRRWAHVEELARRGLGGMTLVDPGSVNVGLTSAGEVPEAAAVGPVPELLPRPGVHVRAQRPAGCRAQHLDLRAGLPAHHADVAPARQGPARRDRQAVLRRRAGVRPAADRRPPWRPTWRCWSRPGCRGRWPCSAATSWRAGWPSTRSAAAGTSGSGWRTTRGRTSRPTPTCCAGWSRSSNGSGTTPASIAQTRTLLGVPAR